LFPLEPRPRSSWLLVLSSALAFSVTCPLAAVASGAAAPPPASAADASAWKLDQLKKIAAARAAADDPEARREWQARANWLREWQPGEMKTLDDFSPARDDLHTEPDLSVLRGEVVPSAARLLDRAIALQTEVHRLDAIDVRKTNLRKTVDVAARWISTLEQLSGKGVDAEAEARLRWALAFARYRRARALAYHELPNVLAEQPVDDPAALDQKLRQVYRSLQRSFDESQPEFVLLDVRMLRRDQRWGTALQLLERHRATIRGKWYLKKRRDLLEKLGWQAPWQEAAAIYEASGLADDS